MTVNEFIEYLEKLREQGKGHYLVKQDWAETCAEDIDIDDDGKYINMW
jgi:hypothetical protein